MKTRPMLAAALCLSLYAPLSAEKLGSVEPIVNPAVVDTTALQNQPLRVREAFATRLLQCGLVDQVVQALSAARAITTINELNTSFAVSAGGFAGRTNPAFVFTAVDAGPNAASGADIRVLTDSLGFVLSQASAFLFDPGDPSSLDFPSNYVVLGFPTVPTPSLSAALFEAVGRIDPELFSTDTSGYTQVGRAYVSLQSAVPDAQFISGYSRAATQAGVEYTPVVGGIPSLFLGGAAFPGNDWTVHPDGDEYLSRIPAAAHGALRRLRAQHLRTTREVLRRLEDGDGRGVAGAGAFECR